MAAVKTVVFTDTLKIVAEYQTICFKKGNIITVCWGWGGGGEKEAFTPGTHKAAHLYIGFCPNFEAALQT